MNESSLGVVSLPRNPDLSPRRKDPASNGSRHAGSLRRIMESPPDANNRNAGPTENVPLGGSRRGARGGHRRLVLPSLRRKGGGRECKYFGRTRRSGRLHRS